MTGTNDPNIKPKDKENILKVRDPNTISGKLKINVVHAKGLKISDSNSSDPYALVLFPNHKER